MGAQIVEDYDVARLPRRHEELFDIGLEALAVNGPVEQAGRFDAVVAQRGEESRGLPLALRDRVDEPLSLGAQPRRRVMLVFVQSLPPRRGVIDEDQPPGVDARPDRFAIVCGGALYPGDPTRARRGSFLSVTIRRKKRLIIEVSA